jgi:acetyltransferase-like isoleucine patch superfamily enzyme
MDMLRCFYHRLMNRRFSIKSNSKISKNSICSKAFFEGANRIGDLTDISHSIIGYASYIGSECLLVNSILGKYCSIGHRVKVLIGSHPVDFVSTHPAFYDPFYYSGNEFHYVEKKIYKDVDFENGEYYLSIGNDVWIGSDVRILSGLKIGDGAIIAAGAIVVKDVNPYEVVGGVPAKKIKERFSVEEKKFLMNLRWWDKDEIWIRRNARYFDDINKLISIQNSNAE